MEYPDVIDPTKVSRAVSLTRDLLSHRKEPPVVAKEAVARTFCTCVTAGEYAAEGHYSVIQAALIETVVTAVSKGSDSFAGEDRA